MQDQKSTGCKGSHTNTQMGKFPKEPVCSLAVVLTVVLVVLRLGGQLELTLTALLKKPFCLNYKR